jgi:phospholipid/cholesterol/gamma-HCH transport system ATP-binding protein
VSGSDRVAVRLDRVSKRFGSQQVLDDVSFDIPRGKAFVLIGRSGAGKSVALRHIIGLVRPDSGRVLVEQRDVAALRAKELSELRKRLGFLFQNAALFDSMTVGENVAFPMRRHTRLTSQQIRERARQKLAAVGLADAYDKMPAELSGGMKKRAALARAMALDPEILLIDEPSAGLDPITSHEIDELLVERKRAGTTLAMVTHNIPSARLIADELALLHEGRIVAQGTVDALDRHAEPLVKAFMHAEGSG